MRSRTEKAAFAAAFGAVTLATTWIGVHYAESRWFQYAVVIGIPFVLRQAVLETRIAGQQLWRRFSLAARRRPVVVKLRGDLDARTADRTGRQLDSALRAATASGLTIDVTSVTTVSRTGTAPLIATARDHVPVTVYGASPAVRRTLHDNGLNHLVSYTDHTAPP
ncbi:STAS domain-containing protein [Kitasatospora sp. NPDC085879]|uniref:STAS domain-containing protein n=1 Tax=Kitasatospora sp. NPDC085879 TaxID=3154769 RepID=UPI000BB1136F|nr:STAS domain-containing protein [Streptomyces sp. TLI_235]PBC69986.1 anti-anti-sigma factor [Streptomyces sp. TLI_235]